MAETNYCIREVKFFRIRRIVDCTEKANNLILHVKLPIFTHSVDNNNSDNNHKRTFIIKPLTFLACWCKNNDFA